RQTAGDELLDQPSDAPLDTSRRRDSSVMVRPGSKWSNWASPSSARARANFQCMSPHRNGPARHIARQRTAWCTTWARASDDGEVAPSSALSSNQGQHAQRAAATLLDLQWGCDNHGPLGWQQVQVGEALQPVSAFAVHVEVCGVGRIEMLRLAGI